DQRGPPTTCFSLPGRQENAMSLAPFLKQSRQYRNRGRRAQPMQARLFLEPLESRITPDVTLHNGHLIVNGDSSDFGNHISLDINGLDGILVRLNDRNFFFSREQISSIEINPGTGVNGVDVNETFA